MTCSVCDDKRRPEIDEALKANMPLRQIAERFTGISKDAAGRHKRHLGAAVPAGNLSMRVRTPGAMPASGATQEPGPIAAVELVEHDGRPANDPLLNETERVRVKAWDLVEKAESANELRTAVQALRIVPQTVELFATLTGRNTVKAGTQVNIIVMPRRDDDREQEVIDVVPES